MELRHLRYFVAVAQSKSFGRAAERLHVSQPALSQQIRDLEDHVGAQLLTRHAKGVSLTPAGEAFLSGVERVLAEVRGAVNAAQSAAQVPLGQVLVGLPETSPGVATATRVLMRLKEHFPSVNFATTGLPWLEHPGALLEERIDLGFCWSGGNTEGRYPKSIRSIRLLEDPGEYALLGRDHPMAGARQVTLSQLRETPFALFERQLHPALFDHLVNGLKRHGLSDVGTAMGVGSASASVPLIIASGGWTIVSRLVGREVLPGAVTKRIRGVSIDAGLDLIWRADDARPHTRHLESIALDAVKTDR